MSRSILLLTTTLLLVAGCSSKTTDSAEAQYPQEETAEENIGVFPWFEAEAYEEPVEQCAATLATPAQVFPEIVAASESYLPASDHLITSTPPPISEPVQEISTTSFHDQLVGLAEAGDVEAQYELGALNGQDFEESNKWFLQAAENGHVEAQMIMAVRYAEGQGVEKNEQKAEHWLSLVESHFENPRIRTGNTVVLVGASGRPKWAPRKTFGLMKENPTPSIYITQLITNSVGEVKMVAVPLQPLPDGSYEKLEPIEIDAIAPPPVHYGGGTHGATGVIDTTLGTGVIIEGIHVNRGARDFPAGSMPE